MSNIIFSRFCLLGSISGGDSENHSFSKYLKGALLWLTSTHAMLAVEQCSTQPSNHCMSELHASVGTGVIPVLLVTNPQQQAPCKDQNADKLNTDTADVLK